MRSGTLISAAFAVALSLVGCDTVATKPTGKDTGLSDAERAKRAEEERIKAAILRVFDADAALAKKREALPPKASPSQVAWAVSNYCTELERINMSDCPADFRVAYKHHMTAWRETLAAIQQLPDGFLEGVFMGAMNSVLRGEADGGQSRLEGGFQAALTRVRTTWEEVERIGAKYGAAK